MALKKDEASLAEARAAAARYKKQVRSLPVKLVVIVLWVTFAFRASYRLAGELDWELVIALMFITSFYLWIILLLVHHYTPSQEVSDDEVAMFLGKKIPWPELVRRMIYQRKNGRQ